jgi:hypothetical protein
VSQVDLEEASRNIVNTKLKIRLYDYFVRSSFARCKMVILIDSLYIDVKKRSHMVSLSLQLALMRAK